MPLNKYRVFSKIAETGNMRKAAQDMMYTQQAVSRIVKCMEEDYGFPLFVRVRDGVKLTRQAEEILPVVKELLDKEDALTRKIEDIQISSGMAKQLHIGACGSIVMGVIHNVLEKLKEQHPELSVSVIYNANDSTTVSKLKSGKIDCALMVKGCQEDMNFEPIFTEHFVVALPQNHPLADRKEIPIDDLIGYPNVITADNPYYNEIMNNSEHNTVVVDEEIMMIPIIAQGSAVGIMSGLFQYSLYRDIVIVPLKEQHYRVLGIATRPGYSQSKATKIFMNTLKEVVRDADSLTSECKD